MLKHIQAHKYTRSYDTCKSGRVHNCLQHHASFFFCCNYKLFILNIVGITLTTSILWLASRDTECIVGDVLYSTFLLQVYKTEIIWWNSACMSMYTLKNTHILSHSTPTSLVPQAKIIGLEDLRKKTII